MWLSALFIYLHRLTNKLLKLWVLSFHYFWVVWLMKGGGFGLIMNIVLGLLGGALGGWLFSLLGISWGGILGQLATAIIGAVVILWIASFFKK